MAGGGRKNADEALLAALAGGASVQAAGRLSGLSERTVYRRLQDRAFRARLNQARADMLERALGHLSRGAAEAAVTLRRLLRSADERVKLGAARSILELGAKIREGVDLAQRVAALEGEDQQA